MDLDERFDTPADEVINFTHDTEAAIRIGLPDLLLVHEIFTHQEHAYAPYIKNTLTVMSPTRHWFRAAGEILGFTSRLLDGENLREIPVTSFLPTYSGFKPRNSFLEEPGDTAGRLAGRLREHRTRFAALEQRAPG